MNMDKHLNLGALAMQLQALETETFEVKDYAETSEMLVAVCSTTSSTCSTTSCSA
jgi:thiazolylpeptide-type bacteriocin precursor